MATAKKQEVRVKLHSKSHAVIADLISLEKQVVKSSKNKEVACFVAFFYVEFITINAQCIALCRIVFEVLRFANNKKTIPNLFTTY